MSLLAVRDVRKGYEGVDLLRGVTLSLDEGARVGLVGRNASGKTTLLRILAGVEAPDSGERVARRGLRLGVLTQAPALPADRTVREVVRGGLEERERALAQLEGLHARLAAGEHGADELDALLARQARLEATLEAQGGYDVEHRVEEIVRRLGLVDLEARCGDLSGGERRRVDLARLLLAGPELMLLDEPTNHLDAVVIDWLEDFLLASRTPFLMVTHDRYFLDRAVDRIVELDRGALHVTEGGYADYLVAREARLEREESGEASRRNLLRRETAWMLRGAPARTTKAKARIERYRDLVEGAREEPLGDVELAIPTGPRLGSRVLKLVGAGVAFDGRTIVPPLDLELAAGERLGIIGPNGAGKTTLLRLCTGRLQPDVGRVEVGETVVFAAVDQMREGLDPARSVAEELAGRADHVLVDGRPVRVEAFLDRLLFSGARARASLGSLSGGEQNRVLLAKLLIQGGNVLALDEPTNDLDLDTLRRLEEALLAFPGSALIVSHDRWFLDRVATRVLHLDGRGGVRQHVGAVSDLLERLELERRDAAAATQRAPTARPDPRPAASPAASPARARKLAPWERRELDALPGQVEAAEAELAALDERLADPALYAGPVAERRSVEGAREELARRVEELYRRWEELEERA